MIRPPPAPPEELRTLAIEKRRQIRPAQVLSVPRQAVYYHSGDNGDVIYSLLWVKQQGGGAFYLGPDTTWETQSKHHPENYLWLMPLLEAQPYLKRVDYSDQKPPDTTRDLNQFRDLWMPPHIRQQQRLTRLFEAYPRRFGTLPLPENEAWIEVPDPVSFPEYPVVIHRSPRYRTKDFPWHEVARRYGGKMIFVGLKSEYEEWIRTWGPVAEYRPVRDALDLARIIAGAKLFIGNQSFPMSVALALKAPLIQETDPSTPDCVLKRANAQYWGVTGPIDWPKFGRRFVLPVPDLNGCYELGPCDNAQGLGDTLTITPLVRELKGKAIVKLPPKMAQLAPLFTNLCPVEFTDDYPVFRHDSGGGTWHSAEAKLRLFGKWPGHILPEIRMTGEEETWALKTLSKMELPIAFTPTCSKTWAQLRQKPADWWEPIIDALGMKYLVLQFGRPDYPLINGAKDMRRFTIREMAALFSVIGNYVGVDTGDSHLMLATGGTVLVMQPPDQKIYRHSEWNYNDPRATYVNFDDRAAVDDAVEALLLKP